MKTIKERADDAFAFCETERENAIGRENTGGWYFPRVYRSGYIKGATEQRAIDIDKACEWLKEYAMANRRTLGWGDLCVEFRKAMEE